MPAVACRSSTRTSWPASRRYHADATPITPAPRTTTFTGRPRSLERTLRPPRIVGRHVAAGAHREARLALFLEGRDSLGRVGRGAHPIDAFGVDLVRFHRVVRAE